MTRPVRIGAIGGGLMGRETASALGRWFALDGFPVKAELAGICDISREVREWFRRVPTVTTITDKIDILLADHSIDVLYVALPHHLHEQVYVDVLHAGKDLLAEKPFGIDLAAAVRIAHVVQETGRFVRVSSEFPFLPGAQRVIHYLHSGVMGKLLEVRAGFWHSSDLDPTKPINWKRQVATCGPAGVMADLGIHVMHIPFRMGWKPRRVYAQLQNIYPERPDGKGGMAACDTWDNAMLHTEFVADGAEVPMRLEMKRLAPGETNTWFIEALGTDGGVRFSTKEPKTLWTFTRGKEQTWQRNDIGHVSVFPTITGGIFEAGFPDCFLQMWGAFLAERAGILEGRFGCVTPEEAVLSHQVMTAALSSQNYRRAEIVVD